MLHPALAGMAVLLFEQIRQHMLCSHCVADFAADSAGYGQHDGHEWYGWHGRHG